MAHVPYLLHLVFPVQPSGSIYSEYIKCYPQGYSYCSFNRFLRAYMASRKSLFKGFDACGAPANHSAKGLEFPRMAKVVSRMVWSFRAWRKLFPEWFDACGAPANHFLKDLMFAGLPQITF